MSCSAVIVKGGYYIPKDDLDFVKQATLSLKEALCLSDAESKAAYIQDLETDHAGISKSCKLALANEEERIRKEKASDGNSWRAYSVRLIKNFAVSSAVTAAAGVFLNYVIFKSSKIDVRLGAVAGLTGVIWSYLNTPTSVASKEAKSSELHIKANVERNWMKAKLEQVNAKLAESEKAIAASPSGNLDEAVLANRNLQLNVKSYFESAIRY